MRISLSVENIGQRWSRRWNQGAGARCECIRCGESGCDGGDAKELHGCVCNCRVWYWTRGDSAKARQEGRSQCVTDCDLAYLMVDEAGGLTPASKCTDRRTKLGNGRGGGQTSACSLNTTVHSMMSRTQDRVAGRAKAREERTKKSFFKILGESFLKGCINTFFATLCKKSLNELNIFGRDSAQERNRREKLPH